MSGSLSLLGPAGRRLSPRFCFYRFAGNITNQLIRSHLCGSSSVVPIVLLIRSNHRCVPNASRDSSPSMAILNRIACSGF
jgi:hypothetical protein